MKKIFAISLSAALVLTNPFVFADKISEDKITQVEYSYENGFKLSADLDGDGQTDTITGKEENLQKDENYLVFDINGNKYNFEARTGISGVYLVDINSNDNTKEIVLQYTHHGSSAISVLRYEDNDLAHLNFALEDGTIDTVSRYDAYTNDDEYKINLSVGDNADIYLSGTKNFTDEVIFDSYKEEEKGTLSYFSTDYADENQSDSVGLKVKVNGKKVDFDSPVVIENDRTIVPVRKIAETLNADVEWEAETKTVNITADDLSVSMQIGKTDYMVNNEEKVMDVSPKIINDKTYIPVRALAEAFGCIVEWDDATQTVLINQK